MSEEIIDLPEFLERVQDDKELLLELLDIFSEDYKEKRKALTTAVDSKNFEEIRSIAHSLKGASGNISAKPLRACFLQFEEMGKNNKIDGSHDLLGRIDKEFALLAVRIESLKKELKS